MLKSEISNPMLSLHLSADYGKNVKNRGNKNSDYFLSFAINYAFEKFYLQKIIIF